MKNDRLSLKYRVLRRLVKAANIKKRWTGMRTEELLENRRKQNAKNKIPALSDDAFTIDRIEVMGCPVLRMIHKQKTDKANLFLIGGGKGAPAAVPRATRARLEACDPLRRRCDRHVRLRRLGRDQKRLLVLAVLCALPCYALPLEGVRHRLPRLALVDEIAFLSAFLSGNGGLRRVQSVRLQPQGTDRPHRRLPVCRGCACRNLPADRLKETRI